MLSSVGSITVAVLLGLARARSVLDNDKVGHAVVPVSPAGEEELICASLAEDTAPVVTDMSSVASWLPISSRDEAASRDGGEEISGGNAAWSALLVAVSWSFENTTCKYGSRRQFHVACMVCTGGRRCS